MQRAISDFYVYSKGESSGWLGRAQLDLGVTAMDKLAGTVLKHEDIFGEGCSYNGTSLTSNLGPEIGALLGDWAEDGRASHLTLGVNDDTGVVLEIDLVALSSSEGFALSDDDSWHDLLSEFWLTLLDGSQEQLADGTLGESVKTSADHGDGDDIQVLGTGVVSAVHHAKGWQTSRNSKLDARSSTSCSFAHCVSR